MRSAFAVSLVIAGAGFFALPAFAQGAGTNPTGNQASTQTSILGTFRGTSGAKNVGQPTMTNRPFQTNSNPNSLTLRNSQGNQSGPFFTTNTTGTNGNENTSSAPTATSNRPSDASITNAVRLALVTPGISASAQSAAVSTSGGVVTLTGTVVSEPEKMGLEQIARSIPGVITVVNQLLVKATTQ